jgi:hypothetical protein
VKNLFASTLALVAAEARWLWPAGGEASELNSPLCFTEAARGRQEVDEHNLAELVIQLWNETRHVEA